MRTEQVSIKGDAINATEILFKVLLAQAGQDRTIIVGKELNNLRALFFRPFNEVGVRPVLERLACVGSARGLSNRDANTLQPDAGRYRSILRQGAHWRRLRLHGTCLCC